MKTVRIASALPALALAAALGSPSFAQSDEQSTLDMNALPEVEVQRVQDHCDTLASEDAGAADAGAEDGDASSAMGAEDASDEPLDSGSSTEGGDSATDSESNEDTPVPEGSVNQTSKIDLSTITLDQCVEAGFVEAQ